MLILTGAVTPLSGLTSTVPSIRGYNQYTLVLCMTKAHKQPHQRRRDSRIAHEEVCIWSTRYPHECAHLSIKSGVLQAAWSLAFLFLNAWEGRQGAQDCDSKCGGCVATTCSLLSFGCP